VRNYCKRKVKKKNKKESTKTNEDEIQEDDPIIFKGMKKSELLSLKRALNLIT